MGLPRRSIIGMRNPWAPYALVMGRRGGERQRMRGRGEETVLECKRVNTQLCNGNLAPSLHSLCFLSAGSLDLRLRTEFPPPPAAAHSISMAPSCRSFSETAALHASSAGDM